MGEDSACFGDDVRSSRLAGGGGGGGLRPGSLPVVVDAGGGGAADRGGELEVPVAVVVVGATPRAERCDRPIAYGLAKAIEESVGARGVGAGTGRDGGVGGGVVCAEVWCLKEVVAEAAAVVSVGGFAANALSAWMRDKLETVAGEDGWYAVQADDRDRPTRVVVWGTNAAGTARAAEVFADRLLGGFVCELGR